MDIQDWIKEASLALDNPYIENPLYEARLLAQKITGYSLADLRLKNLSLNQEKILQLNALLKRRVNREPIAYILEEQPFYDLNLHVSSDTLIPRPETELLIDFALEILPKKPCRILDLGTGSGAIACALAFHRPNDHILASDISENALAVAQENINRYQFNHVNLIQSNWFENIPNEHRFDLIISNPPYIAENDEHLENLTYEPYQALVSKENGLSDIFHLITNSDQYLQENGWLMIEHGYQQKTAIQSFAKQTHKWRHIKTHLDYANHDRFTVMQKG